MKSLSAHIKETIKYAALVAVALGMAACDPILDNGLRRTRKVHL